MNITKSRRALTALVAALSVAGAATATAGAAAAHSPSPDKLTIHYSGAAGASVPNVGASGAIAGVLGAYIVAFPRARVMTLVPLFPFLQLMALPAVVVSLNCVSPPRALSSAPPKEVTVAAPALEDAATRDKIFKTIPLGRVGKPEEIAACILFLCTEHAGFISGEIIGVDGGEYITGS